MELGKLIDKVKILECAADLKAEISGLYYDSRKVEEGGLFVAIRGYETDGHKYIKSAVDKGAVCVVCETVPTEDVAYILVEDSREALALCSANFFSSPSLEMCMIGITGTNGKTTSSYLIKHMLEYCLDAKVGLIGTNGNIIGDEFTQSEYTTPESYELHELFRTMADSGCTHVVMEVSSHSLSLKRVHGIEFDVGVFTNLTQDHLDFHVDMAEYADAKAMLFKSSKASVVNMDDEWSGVMIDASPTGVRGLSLENKAAAFYADDLIIYDDSVSYRLNVSGKSVAVSLGIPGVFSAYNSMCTIACGDALGIDTEKAAEALACAKGVKGRVESVPTDGDYTILIDYAHTPDAIENVLKSMRKVAKGRVVVLFGCGGDRDNKKRPMMGRAAAEHADFVIVTSDNPRTEDPNVIISHILAGVEEKGTEYTVIVDRPSAIEWAIENHRSGDMIILAGKGHEDYQIIGKEKYPMDEREIVAKIMDKRKMGV